jgi:lipid A 3-O-deacylase
MNVGKIYGILLLVLVIISGCHNVSPHNKDDVFNKKPQEKPGNRKDKEEKKTEYSRFEDLTSSSPNTSKEIINTEETAEYYIPAEKLQRIGLIGSRSIQAQGVSAASVYAPGMLLQLQPEFFRNGMISNEVFLSLNIDNDLFDYQDWYYTSGQQLEFYNPAISRSPLSWILPSLPGSINYFSISIFQNLYTPTHLTWNSVVYGDRPFASFFCLGHNKYSLNANRRMRMESAFDLGVIGPNALGMQAQNVFHTETPVGWKYQVANDVVVNYSIEFEKGFYHSDRVDMAFIAGGQAGTLYDNLSGSFFLQVGKSNGRYSALFQTTSYEAPFKKRIRYYFNLELENKVVLYDATLQGGMFSHNSVYTISDQDVKRYVFTGRAGAGIGLGIYSMEIEQNFLTSEFDGGKHHFWFRIKNIIRLK